MYSVLWIGTQTLYSPLKQASVGPRVGSFTHIVGLREPNYLHGRVTDDGSPGPFTIQVRDEKYVAELFPLRATQTQKYKITKLGGPERRGVETSTGLAGSHHMFFVE